MIDLYKLQIFDVVSQTGSFSIAAARLYITQSAVSQHIKDLEVSFGQQLFVRGRRGVTLTVPGETLASYSRRIFALVAEAETALTDVERLGFGKLSIGATPGAGIYLIPDWVQQFRARYPQITVLLQTGVTAHIVAEILTNHFDIGIVEGELDSLPAENLGVQILEEVEQHIVVGANHPLWGKRQIALADLDQQSFIVRQSGSQSRAWLEQALHARGVTPVIGAEFDNLESMKRAVTAGRCIAILPAYVVEAELAQNQLRMIPIAGRPLVRSLKLIRDSRKPLSPIALAFVTELASKFPALKEVDRPHA